MVLSVSVLFGLRWTLAQIVTQKNEIGKINYANRWSEYFCFIFTLVFDFYFLAHLSRQAHKVSL